MEDIEWATLRFDLHLELKKKFKRLPVKKRFRIVEKFAIALWVYRIKNLILYQILTIFFYPASPEK